MILIFCVGLLGCKVMHGKQKAGSGSLAGYSAEITVCQAWSRMGGVGMWVARLPVLCAFCYCDKLHDPKQLVEERAYFIYQVLVHHCGKSEQEVQQGRSLKQKPWRNAAHWLVPRTTSNYLSYMAQAHLPRDSTAHIAGPSNINLQSRKCPRRVGKWFSS